VAEIGYFRRIVDGVPVVAAPAEIAIPIVSAPAVINAVTADRLQMVLPRCGPDREVRREPGPGVCSFLSAPRDIAQSGINLSTAQDMGLA
jgi:hypothetical protein